MNHILMMTHGSTQIGIIRVNKMFNVSAKISAQIMKLTNEKTNEVNYLIKNEDTQEWVQLSEEEYNKLRGNING